MFSVSELSTEEVPQTPARILWRRKRAGGRGTPSCDSGECLGQLCSALVLKENTAISCVRWKEETDVTLG